MKIRDIIIIGAGPAGLSAGVYAGRAKRDTLIFTGKPGEGELALAVNVDDFPGFPNGITGLGLLGFMREQSKKFGCELNEQKIISVDFSQKPFKMTAEDKQEYYARSVLIATGAFPRFLGLEKEKEFIGRGIATCAVCDGALFKNKIVAVAGGGDVALEDALYLTKYTDRVFVIHRREELRGSKILQEEALKNPKIGFFYNSEIIKISGDKQLEGVIIKNNKTNKEQELKIAGLFLAIGFSPATEIFQGQLEIDDKGYLSVKDNVKTSIEGIFAAGDVCDKNYRQAVTAAGFGAMAAIEADKWLSGKV